VDLLYRVIQPLDTDNECMRMDACGGRGDGRQSVYMRVREQGRREN